MIRLHNQNRTHTFIDVESGQFISLPKDGTDKPPVNADINGLQFFGKSTQDGEPSPDNPVDIVSIPPEFNLTSCGRNFFNINDDYTPYTNETVSVNDTQLSVTGSWYVSYTINVPKNTDMYFNYTFVSGVNWIVIRNETGDTLNTNRGTFNTGDTSTVRIDIFSSNGVSATSIYADITLTLGITAPTSYIYFISSITYPYRLEDLDGNLHELCSLPDGTCDEYDVDNGVLIKRVKRLTVTSGTTTEPDNYGPLYCSNATYDSLIWIICRDPTNKWISSIGLQTNIICSHYPASSSINVRLPNTCFGNNSFNETYLQFIVLKSDITDAGFTLDNAGIRAYVDKIIADTGEPITFLYPYSEPQIIPIKQYGETYDGQVWDKNEKPKSIQYHTNIFTDVGAEMQCEVRKLGNRAMGTFNWVTENGDKIITEDEDYIMFEY